MSDDLGRAVDARIDAYRPGAVPPFEAIEDVKRRRDRRRTAVGAGAFAALAAAGVAGVLASLTGSGDRLTPEQVASGAPRPAPSASAAGSTEPTTPSSYPYTDCDRLRPGDPLDVTALVCAPENVSQLRSIDCIDGMYVHLVRPGLGDLEGIVDRSPAWREAGPTDPRHGRTPWAFDNCREHG